MESLFMGKPMSAWQDIYDLMVFRNETVLSLKDLLKWNAPVTPQGCLEVAFDLIEARQRISSDLPLRWIEQFLTSNPNHKE